jgi:hypothetical protein
VMLSESSDPVTGSDRFRYSIVLPVCGTETTPPAPIGRFKIMFVCRIAGLPDSEAAWR